MLLKHKREKCKKSFKKAKQNKIRKRLEIHVEKKLLRLGVSHSQIFSTPTSIFTNTSHQ